jgi:hypothetical protein
MAYLPLYALWVQQSRPRLGDTGETGQGRQTRSLRGGRRENTDGTSGRDDLHPKGIKAQRLKRVFGIDIETCPACGGALRIIACIEDPAVINKIPSSGP